MSWRHTLFFILNNTSPPHRDTGLQHLALPPCWIRLDPFNTAPISGYVTTGDQKQRAHLCPLTPTAGSGSIPKIRMHSWPPRPPPPHHSGTLPPPRTNLLSAPMVFNTASQYTTCPPAAGRTASLRGTMQGWVGASCAVVDSLTGPATAGAGRPGRS
jgi:hypothetical protein